MFNSEDLSNITIHSHIILSILQAATIVYSEIY